MKSPRDTMNMVCILVMALDGVWSRRSVDCSQCHIIFCEKTLHGHGYYLHTVNDNISILSPVDPRCGFLRPNGKCFIHILFFVVPLRGSDFALMPREVDFPPVADLILASIARFVRLTACLVTPSWSAIFAPVNSRIEFTPDNVASEIMREPTLVAADSSVGANVLITA